MSLEQVIGYVVAVIVGLILAVICYFRVKKWHVIKNKYQHDGKTGREIQEIRKEIDKLQKEIDDVIKSQKAKRAPASTITSEYDYKSALAELEELDNLVELNTTDFVIYEWDRRNTQHENCKEAIEPTQTFNSINKPLKSDDKQKICDEAIKFTQTLNSIDKTLESDDKQKINEALIDLIELCFNYPKDCELLYRLGMAHIKMAKDGSEELIKTHTEKAIKVLETALELNKKHAEANKWYAIALGLRCQYASMSQKLRDGILIKKHCELACAVKPDDAVVYYILGRFDFEIASLSWWERTAGKAILGDYMNTTFEDALKNFENAERYSRLQSFSKREKKENKTMIAKTLIKLNRNAESVRWLQEAKKLGDVDTELDQEVKTLLQKYQ